VTPNSTGIQRRRGGPGFSYLGPDAAVIKDPQTLVRIKSLVISPAWQDVWTCATPMTPSLASAGLP
jgi:DNA topoisomerase I